MTIIERFDLSIGGRTVALFSPSSDQVSNFEPLDGAIMLSADSDGDLCIKGIGCYGQMPIPSEWQIALSFFFSFIRGFPNSSLDIRCGEKIVELEIFNTGDGVYPKKLQKCKQLFSSYTTLDGSVSREIVTVVAMSRWHILPLDGINPFSPTLFSSIKLVDGAISDYQIVIDEKGNVYHGAKLPPLCELLSIIWCYLVSKRGRGEFTVIYRGVHIRLSNGIAYLPCKKI